MILYDLVLKNNIVALEEVINYEVDDSITRDIESCLYFLRDILKLDILEVEKNYILGMSSQEESTGLFHVSTGDCKTCTVYMKPTATYLLLSGSDKFIWVHNHPRAPKTPSNEDRAVLAMLMSLGEIIGVECAGGYIVSKDGWLKIGITQNDDHGCIWDELL